MGQMRIVDDSHKTRTYRFHLNNDADVQVSFQSRIYIRAPTASVPIPFRFEGGMISGFLLYQRLVSRRSVPGITTVHLVYCHS
jgi:hypothetical protein